MNCGDVCDRCGDEVESCDCKKLTKDQLIDLLVNDLVGTVKQWSLEDKDDALYEFISQNLQFEKLDEEDLREQAEGAGLL